MTNQAPILSVSQLNRQVKSYLENELGVVYVEGEVSNLSKPISGHFYFTLKDKNAQIRCVFFKNRHSQPLSGQLADGQQVIASGKLSLYEARGDYQLIIEQLTEAGLGELYQRFEELKNKLAAEGLFHPERKKNLPKIPTTIGVITSTTGAAIRDILSTLARRFPLARVIIYPSEVQGAGAAQQLISALMMADKEKQCDVLILARGGGSIEDLWAFNNEQLARQIAACSIPLVSGVGHETDFTIADFVADYRAETPTAAANAVTPNGEELSNLIANFIARMHSSLAKKIENQQLKLGYLLRQLSSPSQAVAAYWQTLDYLEKQLCSNLKRITHNKTHRLNLALSQLNSQNPKYYLEQTKQSLAHTLKQLIDQIRRTLANYNQQLNSHFTTLHAVSPLATLDRGYAIATKNNKIVFSSEKVTIGDSINVRLAKGSLVCQVTHKDFLPHDR